MGNIHQMNGQFPPIHHLKCAVCLSVYGRYKRRSGQVLPPTHPMWNLHLFPDRRSGILLGVRQPDFEPAARATRSSMRATLASSSRVSTSFFFGRIEHVVGLFGKQASITARPCGMAGSWSTGIPSNSMPVAPAAPILSLFVPVLTLSEPGSGLFPDSFGVPQRPIRVYFSFDLNI